MSDQNEEDRISEEYWEIGAQFIVRHVEATPTNSLLVDTLLSIIRDRSHADKLDKIVYEARLSHAADILHDIGSALTRYWKNAPAGALSPPLGL